MGGFGPGGGRGHGGRRHRRFGGDDLKLLLLKLIETEPRHGYDLIKEIEALSGGVFAPSPGRVYPTLTLLDEMEFISQMPDEGAKKRFAITDAGRAYLAEHEDATQALMDRLSELGARQARAQGSPVRRAMGNLRNVLMQRLESPDLVMDVHHQMAEIIDEAARKIERL